MEAHGACRQFDVTRIRYMALPLSDNYGKHIQVTVGVRSFSQKVRARLRAGVEALKGEDPPDGSMEAPTFRYIFFALLRL